MKAKLFFNFLLSLEYKYVILTENMFDSEVDMELSYKKLWKLLIDRDMMKKDLAERANISSASIAKLGRNENVNTEILLKICKTLDCDISDIMEVVKEKV